MFKQINKVFFIVVTFVISGLILVSQAKNVSAFSATLTTSSGIKVNASPSGDGTSIHEESINVVSDCRAGYNLSIATPEGSNLYTNGDGSTTAVFTAVDGTSALNSTNNTNKWGYTLTSNPTSSTVFLSLSTTPSILKTTSQTASSSSDINDTFSINYGVKVDNTIVPGSYKMANSGSIVYYLTMAESCNVVDIAYDGNNADAGTMGAVGTGVIHTGVKDGDTVSLIASNFSRSGYGFAGWSLDPDAGAKLVDNDNTNNPIVYGPQEDVTLPNGFIANDTDNDGIIKLYAVWIQSQGNLQGWMGCSNLDTTTYDSTTGALDLTKNSITALTDQRDGDTYAVARLADGNCWMIENLRLDADATRGNNQYDPSVTNEFLSQGYGKSSTYGNFVGLADPESANFTNSTTANSIYYSGTQSGDASINIGTSNLPGYRMPRYNNINTSARTNNPTTNYTAIYSYGNYYTWAAAIADTTYYDNDGDHNTTSLCPIGWRLPIGSTSTTNLSFGKLSVSLGGPEGGSGANLNSTPTSTEMFKIFRRYPNNFLYSGSLYTSSVQRRGDKGSHWSSTVYNNSFSYNLYMGGTQFAPGGSVDNKNLGLSIRCVAFEPENYILSYDPNGGSDTPTSPEPVYANGSATFTISSTIPARSGYSFVGWIDEKGNEVQPGGTYTTKDVNATLYAIWTNNNCNPTATTIGTGNTTTDAVCLQDVKPGMKSSLPTADSSSGTYNLIDARDGQSYTVAKLADGNLWLTKNLNYGSSNDIVLTSYDTDLPSGTVFKAPASTTNFETTDNTTTRISPKILTDSTYGGYYSYAAAIASTTAYSTSGQNITTSICPKGWDLPTRAQYNNLRTISGNTSFIAMNAAPYSFIYAGYRSGTSFTSQTSALRLWTSTNYSSSYAYYTTAYSTATYSSNYKRYGESVRCIASNGTVTINYEGNGTTEYPVTGSVASQVDVDVSLTNTQSNGFTRTGWAFNGWNTKADGTGTAIAASTAISTLNPTPGSTITLYAQWLPQYNITYVDNCKSWASSDTNCTDSKSATTSEQKVKLTNNPSTGTETATLGAYNEFTMTGWKIKEWTTNADGTGTAYPVASTYTVPAGSSEGSGITLYAHWAPIYTVQYDGNGSDNDSTGMGSTNSTTGIKTVAHTNVAEGDTFDLFASNFKKSGYGFIGWSTDANAWSKLTDNDTTNDAKIWGPNEIITAPVYNGTPITTLYAIWAPAETSGGNPVYLQGWTGCSAMTATTYDTTTGKLAVAKNSITALTDERDGEVYTIAKLADENCWMVENLRLADTHEESGSTVATTLTTANTNILASNNTLPITNIYNADSSLATTSNSLSPSSSVAYNASSAPYGWCTTDSAACDDQSRLNTTNTIANITPSQTQNITSANAHTDFNNTIYAYGNYYNWYSATAGYGTYSISTITPTDGDLCPAGWHLPYGGTVTGTKGGNTSGGFYYLANSMTATIGNTVNSNKFRTFPNNFIYAGSWNGGSANSRGLSGYYWSASANYSSSPHLLYLSSTGVNPGGSGDVKYNGNSVRCIASPAS